MERSDSVGRSLDVCIRDRRAACSHCVVSLAKTLNPLPSYSSTQEDKKLFVCLFDLIHYVPSTIFQLNRDRSSWVEPVRR